MQAFEACSSLERHWLQKRLGLGGEALTIRQFEQEPGVLASFSASRCRRVARALATTGQVQVPTLVLDAMPRDGRHSSDPRWLYLPVEEQERWSRLLAGLGVESRKRERQRERVGLQIVGALHRAGVPLLTGTDTPMPEVYPGWSLHEEMARLVDAGLSPRAALRAGTLAPAEFLGLAKETGSVAIGKRADLVLLTADPTVNITNTRRIDSVVLLLVVCCAARCLMCCSTARTPTCGDISHEAVADFAPFQVSYLEQSRHPLASRREP